MWIDMERNDVSNTDYSDDHRVSSNALFIGCFPEKFLSRIWTVTMM